MNKKEIIKYINNSAHLQHGINGLTCVDAEDIADEIIKAAQKPGEWRASGNFYINVDGIVQISRPDVFDDKTTNRFGLRDAVIKASRRNKINNAITSLVHEIQGDESGLFMLFEHFDTLVLFDLNKKQYTPENIINVPMTEKTASEIIKMYDNGFIKWVFED